VRTVGDDHPRAWSDRRPHARPVDTESGRVERQVHGLRTGQFDRRLIAVVGRIEHDHLVAGAHQRGDGAKQRLGGAGRHRDLALGVGCPAVETCGLAGDLLAQGREADARRVLVAACGHCPAHRLAQRFGRIEVGEPLAEIERPVLLRQPAHHAEDGGADLGQFGGYEHVEPFGCPNAKPSMALLTGDARRFTALRPAPPPVAAAPSVR